MQPLTRTHETGPLTNWVVGYDDYAEQYLIEHYVGGEDGWTCLGSFDTKEEAEAAAVEANTAGHTHTHHIDL